MTPEHVRKMSEQELLNLFNLLDKGPKPEGIYDGKAWSSHSRLGAVIYRFGWRGKKFTDKKVVNSIFGLPMFEGILLDREDFWMIHYPQFGLYDDMKWTGDFYLGRMRLKNNYIWFTLL